MANFHTFRSAILAAWNKSITLFAWLLIGAAFSQPALAQDELSEKERLSFNEQFFEAQALKAKGDVEEAIEIWQKLSEKDPSVGAVRYELAQALANQNEREGAVRHAERAVQLDPENEWYQRLLGMVYGRFDMYDKQVAHLSQMLDEDRRDENRRMSLVEALLEKEDYETALLHLDTLETQLGKSEAITDRKKEIYLQQGDLDGAVEAVRELIEAYPSNMDYYGTLGQLYSVNGFEEEAFDVYQKMLELDSTDPRPHLDLANYYRSQNDLPQSLHHLKIALRSPQLDVDKKIPVLMSLFQASGRDTVLRKEAYDILNYLVETEANDPRVYAMYGDYLSRDGRDEEAIEYYKKALSKEGGQKFKIWEQVLLLQVQNEQHDSLAVTAEKAIESFPNQPLPYFMAGIAHNMLEEYEEALYYLEDGLNYLMGNPRLREQFLTQLADVHHRLENHQESDEYFEKALALNGQNATALNNYAYYLAVRGENLERALEHTRKSNRLSPDNPVFLDTWAWVLYKKGDYAEALKKIEKALSLETDHDPEVLEHYGDILKKNDRAEEARKQYQKALEKGGDKETLQNKIESLP